MKYAAIKKVVENEVEKYYISAFYGSDTEQWDQMMEDVAEGKIMVCAYKDGDPDSPYQETFEQFSFEFSDSFLKRNGIEK